MNKIKYFPLKRISQNIVLIDGISRTGKLLLGSLVSSFDKMEHLEFGENFEHMLPAVKFKKVSFDFAKSYLNNYLNQLIYNKYLSRNVNFRPNDRTGVTKSRNPKIYIKRLTQLEGNKVVDKIIKEKNFIPIVTHDLSANFDILDKLNMNFKIIEILRSPIEIVNSWLQRGLGRRYGKDPRLFTLLIQDNKKKINPWYRGLNFSYKISNNECENCINIVLELIKKSIPNIKHYKNKNKIFLTTYEKITTNTYEELKKISKFLGTKTNKQTLKFIKREKCPVEFNETKFNEKLNKIKHLSSKKIFLDLIDMQKKYENNLYNLN